jgi:hypothetical protein
MGVAELKVHRAHAGWKIVAAHVSMLKFDEAR